jgi:hypothetical protein
MYYPSSNIKYIFYKNIGFLPSDTKLVSFMNMIQDVLLSVLLLLPYQLGMPENPL